MLGCKAKKGKGFSWKSFKRHRHSSAEVNKPLSNVVQIIGFVLFLRHSGSSEA